MTIRKRLVWFISFIIGLIVTVGGFLNFAGPMLVGAFKTSLDAMNSLNTIRELKFNTDHVKTSLNRYLLLGDNQELLAFEESRRLTENNLTLLQSQFRSHSPEWFKEINSLITDSLQASDQVVKEFKVGSKVNAHDKWLNQLYPKLQQVQTRVENLERDQTEEAQSLFNKVKYLIQKAGFVVTILFAIAIIFGVLLFRSLYQAVMTPLETLKLGAEKFGLGHFDHRIALPSTNEFGALAESFNKMADNIKQLQMQAVHMDRMSAVGQLAGGVAHEINNPLTAVLGQAQILLTKFQEDDPKYAQLKKIENGAIRCRKIVRGLLDFSRPSQSRFEQIDVNTIILATLDLCEADFKKSKINLVKNFSGQLPAIKANTSELQQVLLNLLNNAIQAMPSGGTLTIGTQTVPEKSLNDSIRKMVSSDGPWVGITVSDNGVGIPKDHINRVFDPFFTTKDIGKGTGLGLSVSTGIVKKHGGALTVESAGLNKGATFMVILPVKGPVGVRNEIKSISGMAA